MWGTVGWVVRYDGFSSCFCLLLLLFGGILICWWYSDGMLGESSAECDSCAN